MIDLEMAFQARAAGLLSLTVQHLILPNKSKDPFGVPTDCSDCSHRQGTAGQDNLVVGMPTMAVVVVESDDIRK